MVYVSSEDGNVYALDASTGAELWRYASAHYESSPPAVANGMLYIGSWADNVYAFGLPDGDQSKLEAASNRPDLKTLRPDLSLKASKPVTTPSDAERRGLQE